MHLNLMRRVLQTESYKLSPSPMGQWGSPLSHRLPNAAGRQVATLPMLVGVLLIPVSPERPLSLRRVATVVTSNHATIRALLSLTNMHTHVLMSSSVVPGVAQYFLPRRRGG